MQGFRDRTSSSSAGSRLLAAAVLLLAYGGAAAAPIPFVCSNNFYIVQGSNTSVTLNTVNIGTKTLTPVGSSTTTLYNGIGFRPQDGFIWGSDGATANKIVQVDSGGNLNVLPLTGGITLSNSGDVNPVTGLYYNGAGNGTTLYEVNVAASPNPALVRTLTLSQKIGFDMAFSPLSGNAYTVYQGQLYSFAIPGSGTAVTVNGPILTTGVALPAGDTYGAAFFDQNGIFYPYDNKGTLYRINVNAFPATVSIAASGLPNVANNDGAWCAAAPNMTKDASPRAIAPGGTTTYTFTINNILAATNVTFTDTLPAGLTFVPGTVSPTTVAGGTPALSGGNATLTIPGMTLAGTTSYTFTIQAQAANTASGDYPNQANLIGTIYGGNAQVSAVSSDPTLLAPYQPTVISVAVPSLGLAKTSNGPWIVGQVAPQPTFTLTVTNSGTAATSGTITVLDTLPTGISAASGTYSGWTCTVAGQSVSCTSTASIPAAGGTSSIAIPVAVGAAAAGSVTNNASVGGGADPNNGGSPPTPGSCVGGDPHCASTSTTVNLPQLTVTKSASPVSFAVGGTGTYSLTVGNAGTASTAGNITITDALPSGITTTATPSGVGWNCSASTPTNVSCTTAAVLTAGGSAPVISVPVAIAVGTASPAVNTAAATGGGDTTCPGAAHCFDQISTTVNAPQLQVTKTANGPWTVTQSGAAYTLTVTNAGAVATTGTITVLDTMPAGITPSQASPFTSGSWTCNFSSPTLTCTSVASIAATSGTSTISVSVNVAAAAIPNVTNQASVGGGGDPNNGGTPPAPGSCTGGDPHCGSATTTVNNPGVPTIAKAFGVPSIPVNGVTTLTLNITNPNTNTTLSNVSVSDSFPSGMSVASPAGATNSCGGTFAPVPGNTTISLSGGALAAGSSCTLVVNVTDASAGTAVNTTGPISSNESGNGGSASASLSVVAPPSISKAFNPTSIPVNGTSTLTLSITNPNAAQSLSGVAFTDTFPAGMTIASPSSASNTCGGTLTATTGANSINLAGGTIAAGSACSISVSVTDNTVGSANNTTGAVSATESGAGSPSNTATLTVNGVPQLTIAKAASPNPFVAGQAASYTITVSNSATATAASSGNIVVTDTLPAGISLTSASGANWSCTGTTTLSCTYTGIIAIGTSSSVLTLNVAVAANASNGNNAAIMSGGGDPTCPGGANCSSSVTVPVVAPKLSMAKSGPAAATLGVAYNYTLTLTNSGTAATTAAATVTDTVPAGLTINTAAGCTIAGQLVTCTVPSGLGFTAPSNTAVFTINVTPTASATSPVANTAEVSGGGDPNCTVGTPCVSPPVTTTLTAPVLQIVKTGPATATAGGNIVYTIQVTNSGTADATNATLTDPAPGGLTFVSVGTPCAGGFPCNLGTVAIGQSITIPAVTFSIAGSVTGTITNTATVTSDQTAQSSSSASTTVAAPAPIVPTPIDARWMLLTMLALLGLVGVVRRARD